MGESGNLVWVKQTTTFTYPNFDFLVPLILNHTPILNHLTFWFTFTGGRGGGYTKFDFLVLPFFVTFLALRSIDKGCVTNSAQKPPNKMHNLTKIITMN